MLGLFCFALDFSFYPNFHSWINFFTPDFCLCSGLFFFIFCPGIVVLLFFFHVGSVLFHPSSLFYPNFTYWIYSFTLDILVCSGYFFSSFFFILGLFCFIIGPFYPNLTFWIYFSPWFSPLLWINFFGPRFPFAPFFCHARYILFRPRPIFP